MECGKEWIGSSTQKEPRSQNRVLSKLQTDISSNSGPIKTRRKHFSRKHRPMWSILPLVFMTSPASGQQPHPRDTSVPLRVTNHCPEPIWPAILTQNGVGPESSGFELAPGISKPQTVSGDWRGRVWGRTNCSFPSAGGPASGQGGSACQTGDCGMFLECQGSVS
jgi:hypothetical protein